MCRDFCCTSFAADLIQKILQPADRRPSITEVLQSEFLTEDSSPAKRWRTLTLPLVLCTAWCKSTSVASLWRCTSARRSSHVDQRKIEVTWKVFRELGARRNRSRTKCRWHISLPRTSCIHSSTNERWQPNTVPRTPTTHECIWQPRTHDRHGSWIEGWPPKVIPSASCVWIVHVCTIRALCAHEAPWGKGRKTDAKINVNRPEIKTRQLKKYYERFVISEAIANCWSYFFECCVVKVAHKCVPSPTLYPKRKDKRNYTPYTASRVHAWRWSTQNEWKTDKSMSFSRAPPQTTEFSQILLRWTLDTYRNYELPAAIWKNGDHAYVNQLQQQRYRWWIRDSPTCETDHTTLFGVFSLLVSRFSDFWACISFSIVSHGSVWYTKLIISVRLSELI